MKLFKRIKALVQAPERSLRERVFLVLTLCAFVVGLFALLGDILYGENIVEIIVLAITAILTPLVSYLGITRNRVELATRLITLGVICLLMPLIFFFGGGPEGGVVPWLVFSYLYVGLLLSGFWRKLSLLLLTVNVILMYLADYNHPEWIRGHDHKTFILDSALAVIEVGFVCFIMTWFQSLLLQEENRRAKEETQKYEELNRAQSRFFSSMSH